MKLHIIFLFFLITCKPVSAQLFVPEPLAPRTVINSALVIEFGGQRIELLPTLRATKQENENYSLIDANPSDSITKDKLGVAYSYSTKANALLSGEIIVKLKTKNSIATLGALSASAKLLVAPDTFLLIATSPLELVRLFVLLKSNPAVEWVEPFIVKARIN